MENLSGGEILESFFLTQDLLDAQFQYWLSASIAVVVARFIGDKQITTSMSLALAGLYLLATTLFALRYVAAIGSIRAIVLVGTEKGLDLSTDMAFPITITRVSLFVFGTVTTLWFLLRRGDENDA